MRGPGEGYSDVIGRLAKGHGGKGRSRAPQTALTRFAIADDAGLTTILVLWKRSERR